MKLMVPASLSVLLLAAACGGNTPAPTPPLPAGLTKFVLAADPGASMGVVEQKNAGPADQVTVRGRIANVVKGYAVFTIMDLALPYCGEQNPEDNCRTPWDYCCEPSRTRTANSMVVELRGADGRPLQTPSLPDLRLLDDVVVTGRLSKDADGNFVLAATGVFLAQRPKLPDYVRWPQ